MKTESAFNVELNCCSSGNCRQCQGKGQVRQKLFCVPVPRSIAKRSAFKWSQAGYQAEVIRVRAAAE